MMPSWMIDPEAFSGDYDEYRQFMQEQAQEQPERDALDFVREAAEAEDDCPMDGDAESALASAGFGTDEDYGGYTHDWEDGM